MNTLLEIAKEKGAIVFNETNKSNIVFKTEAQLIATHDAYCKQFEPVAYRQHIQVYTNEVVTKEFGYSDIQIMQGDDALFLHPAQIPSEVKAYIERLEKIFKQVRHIAFQFNTGLTVYEQAFAEASQVLLAKPAILKD